MPCDTEHLTRVTTRSKNATTHPGTMAQDALRVRRTKEEVAKEKELKNAQREAKKEKRRADEAQKAQGKIYIARLKAKEAAAAAEMEKVTPRKRTVTQGKGNRVGKLEGETDRSSLTPLSTSPQVETMSQVKKRTIFRGNKEEDSDVETSPPLKKAKVSSSQPLRRTETTLEAKLFDEEQSGVKETGYRALTDDVPTDVEMEDDPTPRPRKKDSRSPDTERNETPSDEGPFQSPLTRLRSKKLPSPNSSDSSEDESPVAKKEVGVMKGKGRAATTGVKMLRNRTDNREYAANKGRRNDLPSDSESNPTKAMVVLESDPKIVNQKKAGSKHVAERDASRKEHGPLAVRKLDSNFEDSQLHGAGFKKRVFDHNRGFAEHPNKIDLTASFKSTRVTQPSHSTPLTHFPPRLTTSNAIVAAKHPQPAHDPSPKHSSKVTTKAPAYNHNSKPTSSAALVQSTDDRRRGTSKLTSRAAKKEPAYDRASKSTTSAAIERTFKPPSRAVTQEAVYDRLSKSTIRNGTLEAHDRTSRPTSRAATQELVYDCPSRSTKRAAAPELAYARTSKPTSRAIMQEPVHHRTFKPTSRAEPEESVYNRLSKSTKRVPTPGLGYDRTFKKVTMPERPTGRTSKPTSNVPVQEMAYDRATNLRWAGRAASREPVSDHEHFGWSEEDDTRDEEAAMSSPLKGSELRAEAKFIKVKEPEAKFRKRASILDLPKGANDDSAWTRQVVPNFINLILAGEHPWLIADNIIVSELQRIWNHVYGNRVSFTIERKSVPFDLAWQRLWEYRNKLAYKAVCVVFSYYRSEIDEDANVNDNSAEIAKFAKFLVTEHNFVFKGMENLRNPTKSGTFQHILIIETLSAHFSGLTEGLPLNGVKIGEPQLSLALTAAAVERALQLFASEMIEQRVDTKGKVKFGVRKSHHPKTGKHHSTSLTEFSAAGWNHATMDYLDSIQELGDRRLRTILDNAKSRIKGKNKEVFATKPKSTRSALHSDSDETNVLAAYAAELNNMSSDDDFYE